MQSAAQAFDSRVARVPWAHHDSSAPRYTFSLFLSESQGSWHRGSLAVLLLTVHWAESSYQCPASCLGLNLNSENKEKSRFKKKIQISEKVEDTNTYLPEDCNVFWNGFQLIGLNARCWSWSLRHPQTWAWRFSSLKGNTKIPWLRAARFLNPQRLPSGFPPKISGLVPFHSYWNAKLSHTFLMSSWDKAAFRQPRHQLPLWACRLLIKENVEIMRVLVGKIPVGQLSPACCLYFIPWCVSYRGCETVSG